MERQVNRNKEHRIRNRQKRDARLIERFRKDTEQQIATYTIDELQNQNNALFFELPVKKQKVIISFLGISEIELQKRMVAINRSKREKAKQEATRIDNNLYRPFERLLK